MTRIFWGQVRAQLRRTGCMMVLALMLGASASAAYAGEGILVFGDSLSAGYGIERSEGWVALLRDRLAHANANIEVVNASVSGETSAGGRGRLEAALDRHDPAVVILELGANDGLRALPIDRMKANLEAMVAASREAGAKVLLLGMRIPSNYGPDYSTRFHQAFVDVAEATDVAFVPFFLEPIAMDRAYFQNDGVHPNAEAQPKLLDIVWPKLRVLLGGRIESAALS